MPRSLRTPGIPGHLNDGDSHGFAHCNTPPPLNWASQTIWTGDNLDVMRGMNSGSVDLIYLDPPFNSNANYAAPIGSEAAGAEFKDTWGLSDINLAWHGLIKADYPALYKLLDCVRDLHSDSMMSYLIYMAVRIMEMKRLLKPTGSIYLHCDPTASHYLKLLMDAIFGKVNFRNEVVWAYRRWPAKHPNFQRMHDILLRYVLGNEPVWNQQYEPLAESTRKTFGTKQQVADFSSGHRKPSQTRKTSPGAPMRDVWDVGVIAPSAKERTGYPTQKPLKLLARVVQASSNPGDMVLDPFCGCATACIAAELAGRQWVGIDVGPKAAELVQTRLQKELDLYWDGAHRTDIPRRTDLGNLPKYNAPANKQALYGVQGGYCLGCGTHFQLQHLTVDHIIPRSKGGTDHISNLQLLCGHCNSTKGNASQAELLVRLTDKGLLKRTNGRAAATP